MTEGPAAWFQGRGLRSSGLALAFLAAAAAASAHDLWILPGKYRLAAGETTRVFINNGDVFPESLTLLGRQRVDQATIRGPDGPSSIDLFRVDGRSLTFDIVERKAGTYVVAIGTRPRRVRMGAEDFRDYLTEEKLDEPTKLREERNESDEAAVESYSKWAKAVIDVGGGSGDAEMGGEAGERSAAAGAPWEEPVGLPLEIVPLRHPNRVEAGGTLPIRVLFRGEPLAAANVIGGRASGEAREIETRTDGNGEVTVTIPAPGRWYLRALHMIRRDDDPEIRWESFWSTLTFEVSMPHPR